MSASALPLETVSPELARCSYFAFCCPECGELRAAVAGNIPDRRFQPCPACKQKVACRFLGKGATVRPLPFWEKAKQWLEEEDAITTFWRARKIPSPQAAVGLSFKR